MFTTLPLFLLELFIVCRPCHIPLVCPLLNWCHAPSFGVLMRLWTSARLALISSAWNAVLLAVLPEPFIKLGILEGIGLDKLLWNNVINANSCTWKLHFLYSVASLLWALFTTLQMATTSQVCKSVLLLKIKNNVSDYLQVSFTLNEELTVIDGIEDKTVSAPREHPFTMQSVGGQTLAVFTETSSGDFLFSSTTAFSLLSTSLL